MPSANKLDHTVINVGFEMDPAEEVFNKLGFTLTPRGYHSTGSFNHLMMFGTDYLELLGLPEGGEHSRADIANAPKGINGLVFKTDDADATYEEADGRDGKERPLPDTGLGLRLPEQSQGHVHLVVLLLVEVP